MAVGAKVKGITIEFDGETTKLGNALKQIDQKAAGVDKSLKAVNKSLKFNPGNTELLAQKQQLLAQKIEQTKDRLKTLQETQKKLDADDSVDKNSQEYMELRREIIETESKLRHFQEEAKKLNNIKLQALGAQVEKVGQKMQTVGKNMSKYVTAPIVALGAASIAAFKQVDAGMDIVAQKTGATGKALSGMQDTMKELATEIPVSFEEAGSAVGEVNTRFGVTGEELKSLSSQFLKFAKLNNTDVSNSIDKVQKAMAAYGLNSSDVPELLDELNKVGQDTGISMDALADSLVKNAPALQGMGLNASNAATFLGQLEKSGADSSKVLSGLNRAIASGAKEGKSMADVLEEVQDKIVNAKDDTEAMAAAAELFGTKAGPQLATAARNGSLNFRDLGKAAESAAGNVSRTFDETLDPMDKFTTLGNQVKILGAEIGANLLDILMPAMRKLADIVKKATERWRNMSPAMQGIITKIAGLIAAVGPLLVIGGKLVSGVGTLIKAGATLSGSLIGLVGRFGAMIGPIGLVVGAIAGLSVALISAAVGENKFAAAAKKAHEEREKAIESAQVQSAEAEIYADKLDELAKKEHKSAQEKELMQTYVDKLNETVPDLALEYDKENDKLSKGTEEIKKRIAAYKQEALAAAYRQQMSKAAEQLVKSEANVAQMEKELKTVNEQYTAARKRGDQETMNSMAARAASIQKNIEGERKSIESAKADMDSYAGKATQTANKVTSEFAKGKEKVGKEGKATGASYASGLVSSGEAVASAAAGVKKRASANLKDNGAAKKLGQDYGLGYAAGIASGNVIAAVIGSVKDVVKAAREQTARSQKSKSPSKVAARLGGYWTEGYALGIQEETPSLVSAINRQMNAVKRTYGMAQTALAPVGVTGTSGAINVNLANEVANALMPILQALTSTSAERPITIENYLYPNGAKMGEVTVGLYDEYKKRLG